MIRIYVLSKMFWIRMLFGFIRQYRSTVFSNSPYELDLRFESSVNPEGSKTKGWITADEFEFESSVNPEGSKTR